MADVHDLHVWNLSVGLPILTAHVRDTGRPGPRGDDARAAWRMRRMTGSARAVAPTPRPALLSVLQVHLGPGANADTVLAALEGYVQRRLGVRHSTFQICNFQVGFRLDWQCSASAHLRAPQQHQRPPHSAFETRPCAAVSAAAASPHALCACGPPGLQGGVEPLSLRSPARRSGAGAASPGPGPARLSP